MIENSKRQILDYLYQYHTATTSELSTKLSLTKADIRYHLKELIRDKKIVCEAIPFKKNRGRGRPGYLYRIASNELNNNYQSLCHYLLVTFINPIGEEETKQNQLSLLSKSMILDSPQTSQSLTGRLIKLIDCLNQQHYQATWHSTPTGPIIQFKNCPYASIWQDHPDLCQLDQLLIENGTGKSVSLKHHQFEKDSNSCVFFLKTPLE